MARDVLREAAEAVGAASIAAVVGLSLYLDARHVFDVGPLELIALSVGAFLIHDIAHRAYLELAELRGRFRFSLTGSAFSLVIAGVQSGISLIVSATAGPGVVLRLAPYRFLAPGTVMAEGLKEKASLGRLALIGPGANMVVSWLAFLLAFSPMSQAQRDLVLLASAFNAYMSLTSLLPFAFCDGLTIYWWDKRIWAVLLGASVALIALSNTGLLLMAPR